MRLKDLEKEGFIKYAEQRSPMMVLWRLTEKGKDTLPILMQMVAFGSKWYSTVVFEDKMPRKSTDVFPQPEDREIIIDYTRGNSYRVAICSLGLCRMQKRAILTDI